MGYVKPKTHVGWVVMERIRKEEGAPVVKKISKNFTSQDAANTFCDLTKKEGRDCWVSDNYK